MVAINQIQFFTEDMNTIHAPKESVMEFHTDEKFIYIVKLSVLGCCDLTGREIDNPLDQLQRNNIVNIFYIENEQQVNDICIDWHDDFSNGEAYIYESCNFNLGQKVEVENGIIKIEILK